jgi:hypothetical protein
VVRERSGIHSQPLDVVDTRAERVNMIGSSGRDDRRAQLQKHTRRLEPVAAREGPRRRVVAVRPDEQLPGGRGHDGLEHDRPVALASGVRHDHELRLGRRHDRRGYLVEHEQVSRADPHRCELYALRTRRTGQDARRHRRTR